MVRKSVVLSWLLAAIICSPRPILSQTREAESVGNHQRANSPVGFVPLGPAVLKASLFKNVAASPQISSVRDQDKGKENPPLWPQALLSKAPQPLRTFDSLIAKAQSTGSVMVIVRLNVPFQPEGSIWREEGINAQRKAIEMAHESVLETLSGLNVSNIKRYSYVPYIALQVDSSALEAMRSNPNIASIIEDVPVPPLLNVSAPLIGAPAAWARGFSGAGQTVAILDTGVDKTHPFLAGKVVSEACFSTNNAAYQANSLCPGGASQSTSAGSGVNCPYGGCEHGTHVAGIVAAKLESISGIARDADIIAIKVFSAISDANLCGGYRSTPCVLTFPSDQLLALERVQQLSSQFRIAAVNMSLGGGQYFSHCGDDPRKPAIDNLRSLGIATVIASGNEGYQNAMSSPGCITSAISVGSTEDGNGGPVDQVSDFSNSASFLDLLAPGGQIFSSVPGGGGKYLSGTSMAAPHVAGAWAVLKSKTPSASVDQVLAALKSTGKPVTDYRNGITIARIRVDAALDALSGPDTTAPTITIDIPSADPTFTTDKSPLYIGGSASDNVGVTQVTWSNSRGGSGTASFVSPNWTVKEVVLQSGTNVITVTAWDAAGNTGSDSITVTYNPPGCSYTINPTSRTHGSAAGSGSVSVATGSGCAWTVLNNAGWITVTSGSSGSGNGAVSYSITANSSTSSRSGVLTIGGQTYTVTQQGAAAVPAALTSGVPLYGVIASNTSATSCTLLEQQYSIAVPSGASQLIVALNGNQDLDLFVRSSQPVSQSGDTLTADISSETTLSNETIYAGPQSSPPLTPGVYYIGIANCPNSPGSFTLTATVVTAASPVKLEEIAIDDGTSETGLGGDGLVVVNRLVPPRYPSKLRAIRIDIWKFQNYPDPVNQQIRLIAFADASGSGRPAGSPTLLVDQSVTVNGKYGFIDFPISNPPSITSGDWYVGFQYANPNNGVLATADSNGTKRERSFYSDDGGATFKGPLVFSDNTKANLLIRAVVESGLTAATDTPVIDSATAYFESDGSIRIELSGRDQGANVTSINETRLDLNGQTLGSGTFDISFVTSGKSSFTLGISVGSGNRLADTRQMIIKLIDAASFQSAAATTAVSGGGAITVVVPANGANTTTTSGADGPPQAGYATVEVSSGTTPYGTAVVSYAQNGVILSEVGVPSSPPTTSARVFIDFRTGVSAQDSHSQSGTIAVNTGFAVVNRGTGVANITYVLRNYLGKTLATGNGTLPQGAHRALFIDQLYKVAPNFNLPPGFSTNTGFGTLDATSDQPLSILALRLTTNQRGETLLTSTPIADLTKTPPSGPLYFPHLADGGGYKTSIILLNTSAVTETGTLRIYNNDGSPLPVKQVGDTTPSAGFSYSIQPGGHVILFTDGSPATANAGSVQITPNAGSSTPVGAGVFSYAPAGIVVTESGIPAATLTTHAKIYVDESNGHNTGLAIANPNSAVANVTVRAYQVDGVTAVGSSKTVPLRGFGHTASFVWQMISGLPRDFTGVLDISSSVPFAALTLRSLFNSRDFLFATFPMADATQTAPSPILFTQIADGGGYKTQIILLSPGGGANTRVSYFGDDGAPITVTKSPNNEERR